MAKANRRIRELAVGDVNWWEFFNAMGKKNFRSLISYLDADDVLDRTKEIRAINDKIKERKRAEQGLLNQARYTTKERKEKQVHSDQIQYGFDLAKWWIMQHE